MDLTKTKIRTTNQICFTNSHSWDEKTKRVELYCTCSFASSTLNNCESNHDRCSPKEGWMYLFLRLQQRQLGFIEVVIFIGRKGINPEAENKCCNNAKPEEVPRSHSGSAAACLWKKQHTNAQLEQQKEPKGGVFPWLINGTNYALCAKYYKIEKEKCGKVHNNTKERRGTYL